MDKTVKVACVGTGWVAGRHLTAMTTLQGVELVGVAGRTEERAAPLARRFNTRAFGDYRAMLDATKPDALIICTIPAAHGDVERAAIERGVPFLVEKPLATDWKTAEAIAAEVTAAKLMTSVGYHFRYAASVQRARELLAGQTISLVEGWWLSTTPPPAWWSKEELSGGQMIEQTTHIFDLARYLLGEARSVYGMAGRVKRASHPESTVAEVSSAAVTFESGAIGTFNSSCILPQDNHRVGLHLYADGLALELTVKGLVVDRGGQRLEYRERDDAIATEGAAFLQAVRTGDRSGIRSTYADALLTHRLTTAATDSARSGMPEQLRR